MPDDSKKSWKNEQPGALGNLLQRVTSHFTPNEGSSQFQSGFVPSATPPWSHSQGDFYRNVDASAHDNISYKNQVPFSQLPAFPSTNLDSYDDNELRHSALYRSSSDLGQRFSHSPLSGAFLGDIPYDTSADQPGAVNTNLYFSDNLPVSSLNSSIYFELPNFNHSSCIPESRLPSSQYQLKGSHEQQTDKFRLTDEASSSFSNKLSNFTASLGTWLSPLDSSGHCDSSENVSMKGSSKEYEKAAEVNDQPRELRESAYLSLPVRSQSDVNANSSKPKISSKLSYSDVLSKGSSQDLKTESSRSQKTKCHSQNASISSKTRDPPPKSFNNKYKSRISQNSTGRSSPSSSTSASQIDFSNDSKNIPKLFEISSSRLDDFEIVNVGDIVSDSVTTLDSQGSSSDLNSDEMLKKQISGSSEDVSPTHIARKGSKKNVERPVDLVAEEDQLYWDKLNNYGSSSQQKQTPKRTAFINNNLNSMNGSCLNRNKTATVESQSSKKHSSPTKEEKQHAKCDNVSNECRTSWSKVATSGAGSLPQGGYPSSSSTRQNNSNSKGSRGFHSGKADHRSRESSSRKTSSFGSGYSSVGRRRNREPQNNCIELIKSSWIILVIWFNFTTKASLWLLQLILDVFQMSYRLLIYFGLRAFENAKVYCREGSVSAISHWREFWAYLTSKSFGRDGGRSQRNDQKGAAFGHEHNIPLPSTGDEAMRRLLACRGKDPYSILGVTRNCSDEDVKRYYKRQAFLVHPDKNKQPGAEEAFKILAHAFEIIGEPDRRHQYDEKLAEEVQLEGGSGELASLLNLLKEKLEEAANTIRCTNCNKRHKRVKVNRPVYAARNCRDCQIKHSAREGDIWAESWYLGFRWRYYACMEGAIYDISDWAACQKDNLKHLQANTHIVQYRIVSGKRNPATKNSPASECPTDPELEEFFNNLCRERFGKDFIPGHSSSSGGSSQQHQNSSESRRRKGKKRR